MREPVTAEVSVRMPPAGGGETSEPKRASERMKAVAALFGIGLETRGGSGGEVLLENVRLTLDPGGVVLITGPSGSGKSTLLRAWRGALLKSAPALRIFDLGAATLCGERGLVDCLDVPLEEALRCLAIAGLSEARLLLRAPAQLSDGQQFRFRLASFLASDADVLIADEFAAPLDRITARVVAWQLGRFIRASGHTTRPRAAIVATSHADLALDLQPTLHLCKGFGSDLTIQQNPVHVEDEK